MKTLNYLFAFTLLVSLAACGDDDDDDDVFDSPTGTDGGGSDGGGSDGGGDPPMPSLGTQIERMGRPAINTALNKPFETDATAKAAAKNAYNADDDKQNWGAAYAGEFRGNLAIIDSLDTDCGNQALACGGPPCADPPDATRYTTLAGAAADDQLYVDSSVAGPDVACDQFLAVEIKAVLMVDTGTCGGRPPTLDVIDVIYSYLAVGSPVGVTDGVDADDGTHNDDTFPFLGAPL